MVNEVDFETVRNLFGEIRGLCGSAFDGRPKRKNGEATDDGHSIGTDIGLVAGDGV